MMPESKFVQANGIKQHYLDWGGDKAPLVTTHGTSLLGAAWIPVAQHLANHYRVIALDLRGHGDSEKASRGYTWDTLGKDFAAFLDALDLKQVFAVGHSRGGGVMIMAAPHCANRLKGLMLIEPSLLMRNPQEVGAVTPTPRNLEAAERARRRRAVFASREEAFDSYHDRGMFRAWRDENLRLFLEHATFDRADGQVELKCPPELEAKFYLAPIETDPIEAASHFTCPILLSWGLSSEHFRPDLPLVAAFIHKTGCRTAQVRGSHFMTMQYPAEVARMIRDFGNSLAPVP